MDIDHRGLQFDDEERPGGFVPREPVDDSAFAEDGERHFWDGGPGRQRCEHCGDPLMHERVAAVFATLPSWTAVPEVSFSVFGERGVIDWLAWHEPTGSLLVIELKTAVVDVQALLGTLDRYERLAPGVARERCPFFRIPTV